MENKVEWMDGVALPPPYSILDLVFCTSIPCVIGYRMELPPGTNRDLFAFLRQDWSREEEMAHFGPSNSRRVPALVGVGFFGKRAT
jgi:hypothetical protein